MMRPVGVQELLDRLVAESGASRATLRRRVPGGREAGFPVAFEALAPEAASIREVQTPGMAGQPVVVRVLRGEQVVQDDCDRCFPEDEPFHAMLALYGGMRAQVVTPIRRDGETFAILSLHELKAPRAWTPEEVERCSQAAARIGELLDGGGA